MAGDIVAVLSMLKAEVDELEVEIVKVEQALLADPESSVWNRKFERLCDEKRNKEARREHLENQLTCACSIQQGRVPVLAALTQLLKDGYVPRGAFNSLSSLPSPLCCAANCFICVPEDAPLRARPLVIIEVLV